MKVRTYLGILACISANFAYAAVNDNTTVENLDKQLQLLESKVKKLNIELNYLKKNKASLPKAQAPTADGEKVLDMGPVPVVSAPYFLNSIPPVTMPDLLIMMPDYNQDVQLLQYQQILSNAYKKEGLVPFKDALIEISGKVESQVYNEHVQGSTSQNSIDLTGSELDIAVYANTWVTGFIALAYDNSSPSSPANVQTIGNSNIYLDSAFVTVGNYNKTPFYATLGQRVVPFGQYNSYTITGSLLGDIGKTHARSLLVGYQLPDGQGLYTAGYVFKGDSYVNNSNNINNLGGTIGYAFNTPQNISINFGVDYLANIADSDGMQSNGNSSDNGSPSFNGFGTSTNTEQLQHRVPALDLHATLAYKDFTLLGEYTGATKHFSPLDLSFDDQGARPQALHIEGAYAFTAWDKPNSFALSADYSKQSLALLQPRSRYMSAWNISLTKNLSAALEYRRDVNYSLQDISTGGNIPTIISSTGKYTNTVTAQLGLYF